MQDKIIKTELDKVLSTPAAASSGAGQAMAVVVTNTAAPSSSEEAAGAGASTSGQSALADAIAQSNAQLEQVRASVESQLASLTENTQALVDNTTAKSVGSAAKDVAGSMLNSVLGGGLLGPVVSGLMDLFGGSSQTDTTSPLVKFALPPAVSFAAGTQNGQMSGVDYGQNDQPRAGNSATPASPQQITVNVSAMDSRSFLDHSSDIANAVRRAMLESSSLNDVIGEM